VPRHPGFHGFLIVILATLTLTSVRPAAAGEVAGRSPGTPLEAAVRGFDDFKARHGEGWDVLWNGGTGYGRFLSGSTVAPLVRPRSSTDFADMTKRLILDNRALLGVDASQLSVKSVNSSALSRVGTTDKVGVEMVQSVGGVEVYGASLVALFLPDGRLTAIDAQVLPIPEDLRVAPRVPGAQASDVAASQFTKAFGVPAEEVTPPRLVIYPFERGGQTVARLAWMVEARWSGLGSELPRQWMYVIAADDDAAEVLDGWNQVHAGAISGTVKGWASPGLGPHTANSPPVLVPLGHMRVTTQAEYPNHGTLWADTAPTGRFSFGERNGSAGVTARLEGPRVDVNDEEGTDESIFEVLQPGVPETLTFNPGQTGDATAEVNVFRWVENFRTYITTVDPGNTLMNFKVTAKVNRHEHYCNAFYFGSNISFYRAVGNCVNTAYSTVIAHEEGHWANDKADTGNGPDGMGEGAADVWALYVANTMNGNTDDPLIGRDVSGPGSYFRSGENTSQFCGDDNPGCHGEVHYDGEVLMGAFWKMRARLKSAYGATAGSDIANHLWIAWNKMYNQTKIKNVIVTQLLTLDDNDGDLGNGTPHYYEINRAFREQGFPGVWIRTLPWPFPFPIPK
jgi:hypothetical protein